ncbi:hypothetical protein M758_2G123500 [Ceratodon purpureus]|nr:hypothetical protein M758_2G123500 [Ceratodon purpureus]
MDQRLVVAVMFLMFLLPYSRASDCKSYFMKDLSILLIGLGVVVVISFYLFTYWRMVIGFAFYCLPCTA